MEKPQRSKGTIMLKYLQKAATFTITNNHHSPRSAAAATAAAAERLSTIRNISGPIASIIPTEARHKKRNEDNTFNEEPTSPKVTCIGQIKHKKTTSTNKKKKNKQIPSALTRILSQKVRPDHNEMELREKKKKKERRQGLDIGAAAPVPALCQLKRFASGRETLADFDWEKAAAAEKEEEDEEGKEEVRNIYHSAPLVLGGGVMGVEHREIGLWRRRSMAALVPLRVNK